MTATGAGAYQLAYSDASGTRIDVVFGPVRSEALSVSTDPRQQLVVPYQAGQPLRENDKLLFQGKTDSASTIDNTTTMRIPVTIKNMKTGIERETYLTAADFGFTTTDVTTSSTAYTTLGTYTVSAQEALKLGHKTAANSVVYISAAYT